MKKKIILKRFLHRDKSRLFFELPPDCYDSFIPVIRSINGNSYSKTHKCWYAADDEKTIKQILRAFRDIADIDISSLAHKPENEQLAASTKKVIISGDGPGLVSTFNKNEKQDAEPEIIPDLESAERLVSRPGFDPVEFRINETDNQLAIRFTGHYDKEWINEIRTFGRFYWDKTRKEFLLPWSIMTGDSLSDYFSSRGVEVKTVKPVPSEILKSSRKEIGDEIRVRQLNEKALEGLDLMKRHLDEIRYSNRTKESYLALLEFFFRYFNLKDPLSITSMEISRFMHDFIITNGYSASYQNQMISAIKTFYKISGKGHINPRIFERPKRSRALPKVFSKDEVKRILNATRNNKHKLLLWLIYSCGLRRSEVTNIRLTDLDRERGILHIKEGKGRVDRIVPVSAKVWEKIDEYMESYGPAKYLFEGQTGGKYSSESVYRVFKTALHNAGIKKDVGVHSLRHSYATHLHETGLDIRYIQELLGHKSTRTTEIYTHVSRRNLISVRSPIEDLDVK